MVVLVSPVFDQDLGFVEAVGELQVEELAAEVAVEGLDERVLPGGTGFDVAESGAGVAAPLFECLGDEFGAVVATNVDGCSLGVSTRLSRTLIVWSALIERAAWQARASRLCSSVMFRILIGRPSAVASKR